MRAFLSRVDPIHPLTFKAVVFSRFFTTSRSNQSRPRSERGFERLPVNVRDSKRALDQHAPEQVHQVTYGEPTIYALSTAPGKAAIAIIRISGTRARTVYEALCPRTVFPIAHKATIRKLFHPNRTNLAGSLLDSNAVVLFFESPFSATGEDVLELHVHGGTAIVRAVLAAIPECVKAADPYSPAQSGSQIRYAEPGEFTRRAFLNNRTRLVQAEALGEALAATTEQQRILAVQGTMARGLHNRYQSWRKLLFWARGELEALIDFSEDQQFEKSPAELCASVTDKVLDLQSQLTTHMANAVRGELLRSGISVALLGQPNVGKSSLLNRILGRDAAIVSEEAGTTRDIVEVGVDLSGWLVKLGDMAGLRNTSGQSDADSIGLVEQLGIQRAIRRALESNVVIVVQDVAAEMSAEVIKATKECIERGIEIVVAVNKMDKMKGASGMQQSEWRRNIAAAFNIAPERICFISCTTDAAPDHGNLPALLSTLVTTFKSMTSALTCASDPDTSVWQESLGASERQRFLISECMRHLDTFLAAVKAQSAGRSPNVEDMENVDVVAAAESLRSAGDAISKLTGHHSSSDVEDVLGVVFEK